MTSFPWLSICIPAYNRPLWLERALRSIITVKAEFCPFIEIIVSDDSSDPACGEIAQTLLNQWKGQGKYHLNQPRLGMAQNWNQGIQLASGKYVMILHDDDFFVEKGVETVIKTLEKTSYPVLLFGVNVVNEQGKILKKQTFSQAEYLSPTQALECLLSNSSFVRFPAIAIQRNLFNDLGYFNPQWGEPTDLEMWIRLFSRYGVYGVPLTVSAYTVHSQALTMGVFNENTIKILLGFFDQVSALNLLDKKNLQDCQTKFFHQFILAGAFRMLRRGKYKHFVQVMELFELPDIRPLKTPPKWKIIRWIFERLKLMIS